jgi:hypothetical protein
LTKENNNDILKEITIVKGDVFVSQEQIDIADMQCWIFRMAQTKWKLSPTQCVCIFKQYDVFGFIEKCYDILHLSSYQCALNDVEEMLHNRGVVI